MALIRILPYIGDQQGQVGVFKASLYGLHHFFVQLVFRFNDTGRI